MSNDLILLQTGQYEGKEWDNEFQKFIDYLKEKGKKYIDISATISADSFPRYATEAMKHKDVVFIARRNRNNQMIISALNSIYNSHPLSNFMVMVNDDIITTPRFNKYILQNFMGENATDECAICMEKATSSLMCNVCGFKFCSDCSKKIDKCPQCRKTTHEPIEDGVLISTENDKEFLDKFVDAEGITLEKISE